MADLLFWFVVAVIIVAVMTAVANSNSRSSHEPDEDPTVALIREVIVEEADALAVAIAEALANHRIHT